MHIDFGNSTSPDYEFSERQNETIRGLASAMKFVAVVEMILGILFVVAAAIATLAGQLATTVAYSVQAVVMLVLAARQQSAAGSFRSIVDTRGADILHLMGALDNLRSYFHIKRVIYIFAICLIGAAVILGGLMLTSHSSSA